MHSFSAMWEYSSSVVVMCTWALKQWKQYERREKELIATEIKRIRSHNSAGKKALLFVREWRASSRLAWHRRVKAGFLLSRFHFFFSFNISFRLRIKIQLFSFSVYTFFRFVIFPHFSLALQEILESDSGFSPELRPEKAHKYSQRIYIVLNRANNLFRKRRTWHDKNKKGGKVKI